MKWTCLRFALSKKFLESKVKGGLVICFKQAEIDIFVRSNLNPAL